MLSICWIRSQTAITNAESTRVNACVVLPNALSSHETDSESVTGVPESIDLHRKLSAGTVTDFFLRVGNFDRKIGSKIFGFDRELHTFSHFRFKIRKIPSS